MTDQLTGVPAIIRQVEDVSALLAAAATEHDAGKRAERASLEHYRKAGEALLKAKQAVGHGQWSKLLREKCRIPQQRASEYMRLAEGWSKLPPGGSFTLKAAILHLTERDRLIDEIIEHLEQPSHWLPTIRQMAYPGDTVEDICFELKCGPGEKPYVHRFGCDAMIDYPRLFKALLSKLDDYGKKSIDLVVDAVASMRKN